MPRIRAFFTVCTVFSALSACEGTGNQSGPSASGTDGVAMMVPTFEVDPSWPVIPNDWVSESPPDSPSMRTTTSECSTVRERSPRNCATVQPLP